MGGLFGFGDLPSGVVNTDRLSFKHMGNKKTESEVKQ
jgi:hypothetical protein